MPLRGRVLGGFAADRCPFDQGDIDEIDTFPQAGMPANYEQMLVKNGFSGSAKNCERILAEWNKRYSAKSEPK